MLACGSDIIKNVLFCACTQFFFSTDYEFQKNLPFLFPPNANLNSDFQKCIAFGKVSKPRPSVLVRAMHRLHTSVLFQCEYTTLCPRPQIMYDKIRNVLIQDGQQNYTAIYSSSMVLKRPRCENADAVMKVVVDLSVEQPLTNFYLCNKIKKCVCIKYVSSHVINYQHISIAFAIIRVALQEY